MLGLSHFLALLPRHQSLALDLCIAQFTCALKCNHFQLSFFKINCNQEMKAKLRSQNHLVFIFIVLPVYMSVRSFSSWYGFSFCFPDSATKKVRFGLETTKWFCSTKNSGNQTSKSRRRKKSKQITRASASVIQSNFYYPTNKCQFFSHRTYAARAT